MSGIFVKCAHEILPGSRFLSSVELPAGVNVYTEDGRRIPQANAEKFLEETFGRVAGHRWTVFYTMDDEAVCQGRQVAR